MDERGLEADTPHGVEHSEGGAVPEESRAAPPSWKVWALLIWLAGMAAVTTLLISRTRSLKRWHREQEEKRTVPPWFLDLLVATAKKLDLERIPAVVFTDEVAAPAVYGILHPVLLLPARSETLSETDAEHMLLHELAHLKRGDLWWHGLVLTLQIVYWFNPLLIWARRQAKHVRELCCDLTVASVLREKTIEYRKTLLETARRLLTDSPEPALALLGVFEEPFRLVARLRWLEKETWRRRTPAIAAAVMVLVFGIPFVLPMAAAGPQGSLETRAFSSDDPEVETAFNLPSSPAEPSTRHHGPATYIRSEFRAETLVLGFPVQSKLVAISETWVGTGIIAATERGKTVIVDRHRQILTYIDHKHRFWMETPLPLDVEAALGEHSMQTRLERRSSGEVAATRSSRNILGRKCREYSVHSWQQRDRQIRNEETITVWASQDMPFDLSLYDQLLFNLRLIYNRDAVYRSELEKIKGLQMGLELRTGNFLRSWRYRDETVVLEPRTPPADAFAPPAGFEQRQQIEELEF